MVDVERSDRQRGRVMVVTDPGMSAREPVGGALEALRAEGIDAVLLDRARVEPPDVLLQEAAACAADGGFDVYVRPPSARLPLPRVASGQASAGALRVPATLTALVVGGSWMKRGADGRAARWITQSTRVVATCVRW